MVFPIFPIEVWVLIASMVNLACKKKLYLTCKQFKFVRKDLYRVTRPTWSKLSVWKYISKIHHRHEITLLEASIKVTCADGVTRTVVRNYSMHDHARNIPYPHCALVELKHYDCHELLMFPYDASTCSRLKLPLRAGNDYSFHVVGNQILLDYDGAPDYHLYSLDNRTVCTIPNARPHIPTQSVWVMQDLWVRVDLNDHKVYMWDDDWIEVLVTNLEFLIYHGVYYTMGNILYVCVRDTEEQVTNRFMFFYKYLGKWQATLFECDWFQPGCDIKDFPFGCFYRTDNGWYELIMPKLETLE